MSLNFDMDGDQTRHWQYSQRIQGRQEAPQKKKKEVSDQVQFDYHIEYTGLAA